MATPPNGSKRVNRRHPIAVFAAILAALGIAAGGCGGNADNGNPTSAGSAFAWLRPAPAPPRWRTSRLPDGAARLAYPLRWRLIRTDPGTVSAALRSGQGKIRGYLNATPRQGAETPSNWSSFRPDHNRDEGDADVRLVASGTDLRFRDARGSCVVDDYRSSSGHSYREIACIVAGSSATTVVVGAAPPAQWRRQGPAIERAISSFLT